MKTAKELFSESLWKWRYFIYRNKKKKNINIPNWNNSFIYQPYFIINGTKSKNNNSMIEIVNINELIKENTEINFNKNSN